MIIDKLSIKTGMQKHRATWEIPWFLERCRLRPLWSRRSSGGAGWVEEPLKNTPWN